MRIRVTLHDQIDAEVIELLREKSNGGPLSVMVHRIILEWKKQAENPIHAIGSHMGRNGPTMATIGPHLAQCEPIDDSENEEISEESVIEDMKAWEKGF